MSKKSISRKSRTDFNRIDKQEDKDIDFSDSPEITPEMFARAVVRKGLKPVPQKSQITLRMDTDVLEWFKGQGKGISNAHECIVAGLHASTEGPP